ncbi:MAG: helix-turn-helix transcriptional regulator [Acidimicrobiales bacterium]
MRAFVGRKRELQVIEGSLRRLGNGEAGFIEVRGDPGIGKTRLLSEASRRIARAGAAVFAGSTGELERDVPFGVFVDALDDEVARLDPATLSNGLPDVGDLGVVFPAMSRLARRPVDPVGIERYRLHQSVRALLERLATRRPVLLTLDDLHWADEASVELLGYLVRHPPRGRVLLVVAYRPRQASSRLLGALGETTGAAPVRLELGPLAEAEVAEWVGAQMGTTAHASLYRETGGIPLYLEALTAASGRDDRAGGGGSSIVSPAAAYEGHEILEAVRATLVSELAALSPPARAVAEAASVVGDPFEPDLVAAVAGCSEDEVLCGLDELCACDMVRVADGPRRFRFRHPTVRRAIYGAAPAGWRLAAHARVAEALFRMGVPAPARAHHVERSARVGDPGAVSTLVEAGLATTATAPSTAARWFASALRLIPLAPDMDSARLDLHVCLARALGAAGRLEECCAVVRDALEMTSPEQSELRSQLIASFGMAEHLLGRHDVAHDRLVAALDDVADHGCPEAIALQIQLALGDFFEGDYASMAAWATAALASAQPMGNHPLHASAAAIAAVADYSLGRIGPSATLTDRAAALVDAASDDDLIIQLDVLLYLGQVEHSLGRFDVANDHLDRALALSQRSGQSYLVPPLQVVKTVALVFQGRLAEAHALAEAAHERALLLANAHFQCLSGVVRVWVTRIRGDVAESAALGLRVADMAAGCGAMISAFAGLYLAEALLECQEPEAARARLLAAAGGPGLGPIERPVRPWGYEVLARAELAMDDREAALAWLARAEEAMDGVDHPLGWSYLHRTRAWVAAGNGRWEEAAESALVSASVAEVCGLPVEASRARLLAGQCLRQADRLDEAVDQFSAAEATLAACGAQRYRDEAAQELRLLGQRVPVRDRAHRPASRLGSLTRRQREVAELVAAGQTNRQIALGLYVGESTVETHLKHIFRKLNIASRAALASAVTGGRDPAPGG